MSTSTDEASKWVVDRKADAAAFKEATKDAIKPTAAQEFKAACEAYTPPPQAGVDNADTYLERIGMIVRNLEARIERQSQKINELHAVALKATDDRDRMHKDYDIINANELAYAKATCVARDKEIDKAQEEIATLKLWGESQKTAITAMLDQSEKYRGEIAELNDQLKILRLEKAGVVSEDAGVKQLRESLSIKTTHITTLEGRLRDMTLKLAESERNNRANEIELDDLQMQVISHIEQLTKNLSDIRHMFADIRNAQVLSATRKTPRPRPVRKPRRSHSKTKR